MSSMPTLKMKKRLNYVVVVAIVLVFVVVIASLFNTSILSHDMYLKIATNQQLRPETIAANRGTIYDRNMQVVARSATVWDVVLSPADMEDFQKEEIARELSKVLEPIDKKATKDFIFEKSQKKNQYEIITKKVEKPIADEIRQLITKGTKPEEGDGDNVSWKGVDLVENTKRYYTDGTFASSVIGFTGTDSQGLYGIEKYYDEYLKGTPGYIVSAKDAHGGNMPVNYEERFDAIDGNSLVLTIDETIQHFLQKELEQLMAEHAPDQGCAGIVMDVNTGEILAMANYPTFDLNNPFTIYDENTLTAIAELPEAEQTDARKAAQQKQWINKGVTDTYEPGSTFKTIVTAAALEEKTTALTDSFYCPGYVEVGGEKMRCHKDGGHGALDFTGALVGSCNPSFVAIGAKLGPSRFFKYFKGFGLTEKTGIDLPGEGKSQFYTDQGLKEVELASSSFGQSMTLTPLQLTTAVASAVNGGYLVTPHVVKDILDGNGNVTKSTGTAIKRQVVSEETSAQLRVMMERVVDEKGGTNAYVKGYRIGGKSGTSQKLRLNDENKRIASYIAVAPADKPEIAVFIMVDEPTSGYVYGTVVAAPTAASIMSDTLPYLGYSPQYTQEDAQKLEITMPYLLEKNVSDAQSKLIATGIAKGEVIGDGTTVVKQIPSAGSKMPRDGKVYLYTTNQSGELCKVPDVIGLKPEAAQSRMEAAGFNVIFKGGAVEHSNTIITVQSMTEGIMAEKGSVVELTCIKRDTD